MVRFQRFVGRVNGMRQDRAACVDRGFQVRDETAVIAEIGRKIRTTATRAAPGQRPIEMICSGLSSFRQCECIRPAPTAFGISIVDFDREALRDVRKYPWAKALPGTEFS